MCNRVSFTIGFLFLLFFLMACEIEVTPPTGEWLVGTRVLDLTDPSRIDALDPAKGARRILTRVWYPTSDSSKSEKAIIVSKAQADALINLMDIPASLTNQGVRGYAYQNAPPLPGKAWPVIFFDHGGFSMENQNTMLMEDLASHGYVVFALNHPRESLVSEFPDGTIIRAERGLGGSGNNSGSTDSNATLSEATGRIADAAKENARATSDQERYAALHTITRYSPYVESRPGMEVRIGDILFLRSSLKALNQTGFLAGCFDPENVGLIGHSMGGYTVGETILRHPEQFTMAINLDGPQLGWNETQTVQIAKPMLFMYSTHMNLGGTTINMDGINRVWADTAKAPVLEVTIEGMGHFNFTDLGKMPILKLYGFLGPIDGNRGVELYSQVVKRFLNVWLKGEPINNLRELPPDWTELKVRASNFDVSGQ
jgi:dienelactone hydrolase